MSALLAITLLAAPTTADWARAAELSQAASTWSVDPEKLAAHPVDADEVSALLARLMGDCLEGEARCREVLGKTGEHDEEVDRLANVLGEIGGHRELPLLDRLAARGVYNAERAADRILEREWLAGLDALRPRCTPPSADAVKRQAEQLADFFRIDGRQALAAPLTVAERDDLAYFLESIDRSATAVGERSADTSEWPRQSAGNPTLDGLSEQLDAAKRTGDPAAIAKKAREYLGVLGYPGPITGRDAFGWHGARFSYVMRDLAAALERSGEHVEAAALQRHANPSGGMCGTGASARWAEQVRAVIRNTERAGGCATAERMLEIDQFAQSYGTAELVRRGFDLKRLYRGALLTMNREDPKLVARSNDKLSPPDARRFRARLEKFGPEAWETRVRALEATVALSGPTELEPLVALIERADPPAAARGLEALTTRVKHPDDDPCDDLSSIGGFSISSEWSRPVRALSEVCATRLSSAEEDALAVRLTQLESYSANRVRLGLATVLRDLASKKGSSTLLRLGSPKALAGIDCAGDDEWICRELTQAADDGQKRIEQAKFFGPRPAK